MTRADRDPTQAEAVMRPLQDESFRADCAVSTAVELAERLESEIDTAFDAGNDAEVARLTELHLQAEHAIGVAQQEAQAAENAISDAHSYWFEEHAD